MLRKGLFLMACLFLAAMLINGALPAAQADDTPYVLSFENAVLFKDLLHALQEAYESPSEDSLPHIREIQQQISERSESDGFLADAITSHWLHAYLNMDGTYTDYLFVWDRASSGTSASELKSTPLAQCPSHAFIVLGYQLESGEMTDELKGRCEAAAAAARAFPDSVLVCTGGTTGSNNPDHHTEAGMMKEYLIHTCKIDPSRIFTDELSMTTIDNAVHALAILRAHHLHSMTVVTSDYHQKWGQVLCNAQAALEYLRDGYSIQLVENYSYQTDPLIRRTVSARTAISQLTSLLHLNSYASDPSDLP